jgi:hypothetical protein
LIEDCKRELNKLNTFQRRLFYLRFVAVDDRTGRPWRSEEIGHELGAVRPRTIRDRLRDLYGVLDGVERAEDIDDEWIQAFKELAGEPGPQDIFPNINWTYEPEEVVVVEQPPVLTELISEDLEPETEETGPLEDEVIEQPPDLTELISEDLGPETEEPESPDDETDERPTDPLSWRESIDQAEETFEPLPPVPPEPPVDEPIVDPLSWREFIDQAEETFEPPPVPPEPTAEPPTQTPIEPDRRETQRDPWHRFALMVAGLAIVGFLALATCAVITLIVGPGLLSPDGAEELPPEETSVRAEETSVRATDTPKPVPTSSTPMAVGAPEMVNLDNPTLNVEIFKGDNVPGSMGVALIEIRAGGKPLQETQRVQIFKAVQTITGEWTSDSGSSGLGPFEAELDANGMATFILPPGDFILVTKSSCSWFDHLHGTWGVFVASAGGYRQQLVPFTIFEGRITKVTINLAQLDIGVLASDDGLAASGVITRLYCQGTDIAGNPVAIEPTGSCICMFAETDSTGLATHYVGAGTYIVELEAYRSLSDETVLHGVTLNPGEHRTEILTQQR